MLPAGARIVFSADAIGARVSALGAEISRDYVGRDLVLITVLKGGLYFLADLTRAISIPLAIDFMSISAYRSGRAASGAVRIIKDLDDTVTGRTVLLVEDIIDTGLTASYLVRALRARHPAEVTVCTLLDKPARRIADGLPIRYRGFEAPDDFLVGYGLDERDQYRHLPYIAALPQTGATASVRTDA
jgi:hypoxanthine phosphoribosyltransferase